jgi:hypothetical protein
VYVIVLSRMHCTRNVSVTQRKDPEEELLLALLGASKLLIRQPPLASISFPDRMDIRSATSLIQINTHQED